MTKPQELPKVRLSNNQRKFLIGIQYGLLIASTFIMLSTPIKDWSIALVLLFIVAAILSAALHTTLALSIGNICQGRLERLDERERAMRDRAFIGAFQIVSTVVSLAWLYGMVAWIAKLWLPEAQQIWMLLWLIGMLIYGLPTSIAAWQMKNLEE